MQLKKRFDPEDSELFDRAVEAWLQTLSHRDSNLFSWGKAVAKDEDIFRALLELVSWYKLDANDLLSFLADQRLGHIPAMEFQAKLRGIAKSWKKVERLAFRALKESEPYLGHRRDQALEIQKDARILSKYFSDPVRNRPLEAEIADCKAAIGSFLKRRGVRKVNEYGWVLLSAVFGSKWQAGRGKDQIGAYRAIPKPFAGPIKTSRDAKIAFDQAKIDFFSMLVQR